MARTGKADAIRSGTARFDGAWQGKAGKAKSAMSEVTSLREWTLELHRQHGYLTPEIVREEARPPDSPAHAFVFNAPPDEAAELHYLERAHRLIQAVRVTVRGSDGEPPRHVRFWNAVPSDQAVYVYEPIESILREPDKFAMVRTAALRRLREAEEAVANLDALVLASPQKTRTKKALKAVRTARETLNVAD